MGASWMCLIVMLWLWLFESDTKQLCISRNAESVDRKGDSDSLFWKLDYMIERLPAWMRPASWEPKKHRKEMFFENADDRCVITGQASTGKAGVGGRAEIMFIDEFSQIAEATEVRQRTSDTAGARIFNFTFTGIDNEAYRVSREPEFRKLTLHWTQHPEKNRGCYRFNKARSRVEFLQPDGSWGTAVNWDGYRHVDYPFVKDGTPTGGPFPGIRSPWYDKQCKRKGDARGVAMDLDINPEGSMSQVFNAVEIHNLIEEYCCPPLWEGDAEVDVDAGRIKRLIRRPGGPLRLWLRLDGHNHPPPGFYGFGCDVATGSGASPSCGSGLNLPTGEKLVEYANAHIDENAYAALMVGLCWLFRTEDGQGARLAWEAAGPGQKFGRKVLDLGYRNVFYRTNPQILNPTGDATTPGWWPTPSGKDLLIREYREALSQRKFLNRSEAAMRETLAFEYNKSSNIEHGGIESDDPSGGRVNHGDRVIADGLAWMLAKVSWEGKKKVERAELLGLSLARRRQMAQDRERAEDRLGREWAS